MQEDSKILITGGTGFLGSYLLDYLLQQGHNSSSITIFDREDKIDEAKKDENLPKDVKLEAGDIRKRKEVEAAVKGQDVIFHLAAVLDEQSELMEEVNLGGTQNLLHTLTNLKEEARPKLVHVSTVGVMGPSQGKEDETAPYNPQTRYEETKAEAEKLVLDYYQEEGLNVVVVRPAMIYGPNSYWQQIVNKARDQFPLIGDGSNHWHLLYIKNAVVGLYLAADGGGEGEIYILADAEVRTYRQIYQILAQELGVEITDRELPLALVRLLAYLSELKGKLIGNSPLLTNDHITRLVRERHYSIKKAKVELSYQPPYSLKEGLSQLVSELKSN